MVKHVLLDTSSEESGRMGGKKVDLADFCKAD